MYMYIRRSQKIYGIRYTKKKNIIMFNEKHMTCQIKNVIVKWLCNFIKYTITNVDLYIKKCKKKNKLSVVTKILYFIPPLKFKYFFNS